jgi:hypothetical protein
MNLSFSSAKKIALSLYIAAGLCLALAAEAGEDAADARRESAASVMVTFRTEGNGKLEASVDGVPIVSGAMVSIGKTVRFTVIPDEGYMFDRCWLDGSPINVVGESFPLPIGSAANPSYDIVVSFKKTSLSQAVVTFGAGADGVLTAAADGAQIYSGNTVTVGKKVVFTAVPSEGYGILNWTVTGAEIVDSSSAYRREVKISAAVAVDVAVSFERTLFPKAMVTFSAGANGVLTASVDGFRIASGDSVSVGKEVVFTAVPNEGYDMVYWTVNGTETVDTSLTHTRAVEISNTAGENVTVSFDIFVPVAPVVRIGPNPVKAGGVATIYWFGGNAVRGGLSIFDAVGYKVARVKINGVKNIGTWKVGNIARGTYLIKGVLKDKDGNKIKVEVPVGVVR